ncbi:hypothetical protein [Rickettsiella endosymbiont of Rhagonycha lignosa]|uniref:hypothetical protein n=1 Tax=Rickettsiella endosymbiont of Rhagonycha lignosa TaxID=3077937 RepID=UPI00313DBCE5
MRPAKIAFAGPTGTLLNYCSDIRNLLITRTSTGKYTVKFLTPCSIDESKVAYPIINVTCQSPTGTATVVNVLNPTATYRRQSHDGYLYQVSFQIEVQNIITSQTLPNVLLTLLGFFFNVATFVDRSVIMVDCQLTEHYAGETGYIHRTNSEMASY